MGKRDLERASEAGVEPWAHPAGQLKRVHSSLDGYYASEMFACVSSLIMMGVMGFFGAFGICALRSFFAVLPELSLATAILPSLICCVLAILSWRGFAKHRHRAALIKHGSWVVNHIPPDEVEDVTIRPSMWTDEPTLFIDRSATDETQRSYRVFAGASGFTEFVWFTFQQRVEHHSVRLYRDPLTKEPVVIEKDNRIAVLMPIKQKKAPARS